MFERYTEGARRVVFFARYEASNFGSPCIDTEHLLLGLLRAEKVLFLHVQLNVGLRGRVSGRGRTHKAWRTNTDKC